jgi:hypothetical protein
MKYYRINYSTGKETGRDFPQLHCLTQFYAHQLTPWEFPSFVPKLDFELKKTAKLTDILSNAAITGDGLIMSDKAKAIFSKFNLMKNKFFNANIIMLKTNQTVPYNYFHPSDPELSKVIDYKKSKFSETEWTFKKDSIEITSYEHYLDMKAKDEDAKFGVRLEEVYVTEHFDKTLDLFTFLPFCDTFISGRLRDGLMAEGITGLVFEDAPEVNI